MKNLISLVLLMFLLIPGFSVSAFETKAGEELDIIETVNDDLYVAGGRIDISAPVNGDLIIAGGEININGEISEDLIIAGGDIVVSGNIGDDVRAAGGTVRISSNIEGDLVIAAGEIRIDKDVVIKGDLAVTGGRVILDGEVLGNAKVAAEQFIFNGTINKDVEIYIDRFSNPSKLGVIKGDLKYKSPEKIAELDSIVAGEITFEKQYFKDELEENILGFISSYLIIKLLGVFIFASLIFLYLEKFFKSVSDNLKKRTGKSFLYGFLTVIGLPIIIILLFISIIGIPFAFLLLFAYIFIFVFLTLLNTIIITSLITTKYKIKELYKKLLIILGISIILVFLNGVNILIGFFTLGAMAIKKTELLESLRK